MKSTTKLVILVIFFLIGCGPNKHRKIRGELLHKRGNTGIFVTNDDGGNVWWYYTWDSGNNGGYITELKTLPPGGTWAKGTKPPQEEVEEEEVEEATVDTEAGAPEVGEVDTDDGADAGADADGGGDGGE
jgi:hypothetical protein